MFLSIFFGFRKGLIIEIFWLIGILLGLILATSYQDTIVKLIQNRWGLPFFKNSTGIFILILLSAILVFSILGRIMTFLLSRRRLTLSIGNRMGGALFGLVRGMIIMALILVLLLKTPVPKSVTLQIYRSNLSSIILHYSLKAYEEISRLIPQGWTFSHFDFTANFIKKEKIEQLDEIGLTAFQDFLNNIVEDKEKFISEEIKKIKRGGEK